MSHEKFKTCIDACNQCAAECEKRSDLEHCKKSAEACRKGVAECNKMSKS
jgi:hypothetical protein